MCTGLSYRSIGFLGDRAAVIYALHASRGSTLVFNGLEDTTVRIPKNAAEFFDNLRGRVARLRGSDDRLFETGFVPGVGHRPFFVTRAVALWLERILDLPAWSETAIREMPETHVSEWARREGVELDPLYASEHREGGTQALGSGVPGLRREQLNALDSRQWEREKERMIYEAWLDKNR
jgi:hypothetical protein